MSSDISATPANSGGGAAALRSTIIACTCNDEGVCIMCKDCGHIFVPSVPLSDESEGIPNDKLAKMLFYHMCAMQRRESARGHYGARRT